jgi:hypothetical protein
MARSAHGLACIAAFALAFAPGCFRGLDDGALTAGGAPGGNGDGGGSGPGPGPGGGDGASPTHPAGCDDFSNDVPGQAPAGFSFNGDGMWIVDSDGSTNSLAQVTPNVNGRAYAIYGQDVWTDYRLEVTFTPTQTNISDCVDVRWQDHDNHYSLCLHGGTSWSFSRYRSGSRTQLDGGDVSYAAGTPHVVAVDARGSTFTATIDGVTHDPVNDGYLDSGPVAVSTSSALVVAKVCVALE